MRAIARRPKRGILMLRPLVLFVSISALSTLARADVLDVGPGHAYPTIATAVSAATDGDVIRVYAGSYPYFLVDDKELRIVAATNPVHVQGVIRVHNLSAGKSVVIAGLEANGNGSEALILYANDGRVR